ncbi:MAG: transketolase [Anaerolineae bacterium]|nr:transketolase [Anaerolineae bacterium]
MNNKVLDQYCVNTLRTLAIDGVEQANSGHPGMPMGMADVAYVLWCRHLRHNPNNPKWPNRDRFILSAGHGSMLLYGLLYLTGYPISLDDLKQFRQWGSKTPGHPEYDLELGIETTTGPLGQGFSNGVGMAIAQKHLASRFNKPGYPLVNHTIYAIVSDGDLMEGISHEVASLAGHLGLDNLIYFYDDNEISIEGSTDIAFTEDVPARFRAYGWHVQEIDGHDIEAIDAAIHTAKLEKGMPHLIVCHTHIAYGSPNKQDSEESHGSPLGEEEVGLTKVALGWPSQEPFFVPDDVLEHSRQAGSKGQCEEQAWQELLSRYEHDYPSEAEELKRLFARELPSGWQSALPAFNEVDGPVATRAASGKVLNALAPVIPELIGGSADLAPSNKTYLTGLGDFQKDRYGARNLHFGVRELGMGGILNGMALYDGLRVYGGTFLVFSDYMRPAVRLAALMKLPVIYVWTHDSIYVGEDGPTHEPVEHLLALRSIPNLTVIRPADANEVVGAWRVALAEPKGPVALCLTRQKLPVFIAPEVAQEGVARGAYILRESPTGQVDIILIASGSEVADAVVVQDFLAEREIGARVVSMPSWSLFDAQPDAYKRAVLPPEVKKRVAIEAGLSLGWERYVGLAGLVIGMEGFGASAPYKVLREKFGFTPEQILEKVLAYEGLR